MNNIPHVIDTGASVMNNEPTLKGELVAWMVDGVLFTSLGAALNISFDIEQPCIPLYTHPAKTLKDREADRKRFSDEGFNRWLDESISDSGHTVYDLVENVCEAWHGWENSQYYSPAKTLTDEEIHKAEYEFMYWNRSLKEPLVKLASELYVFEQAVAILRKAQEK